MPDESEKFTLNQMLNNFDIQRVSLGGPIFDVDKLTWLNGKWLREDLTVDQLAQRLKDWAFNREQLMPVVEQLQPRLELFSDFAPQANFLFAGLLPISRDDFGLNDDAAVQACLEILQLSLWQLELLQNWHRDEIFSALKAVADYKSVKLKAFLAPIFIAISGTTASISVMDAMQLLGPDLSRARLRFAIYILGGISKKKLKKLEKQAREIN